MGIHSRVVVILAAALASGGGGGSLLAAPQAALKDARIALRYGVGEVLILGGEIELTDEATSTALSAISERYPKLEVGAGEWMNAVPVDVLKKFKSKPKTNWHVGDRWQLYPGAGPPATVEVEETVLIGHGGCGCFREGAVARFLSPASANQIAGLRASDYLAAPGAGLPNVSQVPLFPVEVDSDTNMKIRNMLWVRAREVVKDEQWQTTENPNAIQDNRRIRELNRSFLSVSESGVRIRVERWAPPGGKALLFTLALWFAEIDGKQVPVFAAEAVVEEGNPLKVLSFEYREAEWMRAQEFSSWEWNFDALSRFLNAWRIGDRTFFMRCLNGYEFSGVGLEELDSAKGIVETDLGYAF